MRIDIEFIRKRKFLRLSKNICCVELFYKFVLIIILFPLRNHCFSERPTDSNLCQFNILRFETLSAVQQHTLYTTRGSNAYDYRKRSERLPGSKLKSSWQQWHTLPVNAFNRTQTAQWCSISIKHDFVELPVHFRWLVDKSSAASEVLIYFFECKTVVNFWKHTKLVILVAVRHLQEQQ